MTIDAEGKRTCQQGGYLLVDNGYPKTSTLNNPQLSTLIPHPKREIINSANQTLNTDPYTLNPKGTTSGAS